MANITVFDVRVPYEEYQEHIKASTQLEDIKTLLVTEFPDDTCQLIAIKNILGIKVEVEDEPEIVEPTDPDTGTVNE